jgi:hypothetical protein
MTEALWFLGGCGLASLFGLSIGWTVGRLRTTDARTKTVAFIAGGAIVRLALAAFLLGSAVRQGVAEGLLAFGGLWFGRWVSVAVLWRSRRALAPRATM